MKIGQQISLKPGEPTGRFARRQRPGWQWALLLLTPIWISFCWSADSRGAASSDLTQRHWFEARTIHFHTYSCGATQEVAKLAARLEQFRTAYSSLAGTQAVASPPIVVLAFPDHDSLEQFVPLYNGKPTSLSGFFHRASDENLIVLALTENGSSGLETIFHEFAHLLLRHNERYWPMWLDEGMADIYASFEVTGEHTVRIGKPRGVYLRLLAQEPLVPLKELFAVTHDSPEYNEREHQGIFYAQSWLLAHYLMAGQKSTLRSRFGVFTGLLRKGQFAEQAFTNAFQRPLAILDKDLRQYLQEGRFEPISMLVGPNLLGGQSLVTRGISPAETYFRLGDELLRVGRLDEAESYFLQSKKLAPDNPLAHEGLGLLAAERQQHNEALSELQEALRLHSINFLAHYVFAREKFRLNAKAPDTYSRLAATEAADIRKELEAALGLMPDFAPSHYLLGFLELVQAEDAGKAERHLRRAVELEPENQAYCLALAQVQIYRKDLQAAHSTLQALCLPNVEPSVRQHAEQMLQRVIAEEGSNGKPRIESGSRVPNHP